MAKPKPQSANSRPFVPNSHLYARINFLYQSAQLLSQPRTPNAPLSRFYISTARTVAKKSVLRLSPSLKRTICKRCDLLLVPGATSTHRVENSSRGGRKPWADVLVVECNACGAVKRFPVGMEAMKGVEWRLWSEREDVVMGGEEKTEVQREGSGGEDRRKG
jgi:ribonuclease P protein subunit RPR2